MEENNEPLGPEKGPKKEGEHPRIPSSPATAPIGGGMAVPPRPSASGGASSIDQYRSAHDAQVLSIGTTMAKIKKEVNKVVIGMESLTEMLMVALFSGGNVLLEGVPGIAKTLSAKVLSKSINTEFSRIQFTPDLMPTDILGTTIFNMKTSEFEFKRGPIFSNIILIDEVNRAPAKTQAALMEVMEEKQVTVEGHSHQMGFPFFIIATQNPVEQEGTYKLPEAQMDRFLFRLTLDYPSLSDERRILDRFKNDFDSDVQNTVQAVIDAQEIKKCMKTIESIHVTDGLLDYIAQIVVATRNNGDLYMGASPRASLAILKASKALAVIRGKSFVTPDHVKAVALPVLNHRIILSHERELEGATVTDVINEILERIEIPR